MSSHTEPLVGIFWFYGGKVRFMHAVPLSRGIRYGDAITGTKDHAEFWEKLRAQGALAALPAPLQEEYFSVPRGRVVYHSDTERFFVYHGNNIQKHDLRTVAAAFRLPARHTVFEQDLHYCDLSDEEWRRL